MSTTILSTKLYLPPYRADCVPRPRLLQRLDECRCAGCRLALVSAPAGFGKTTLVVEWIETLRGSDPAPAVAWVSLDEGDNDLGAFLTYLTAALQGADPSIGAATRELLEHVPLPGAEQLLSPLLNELAARPRRFLVVLDDYHTIQLPAIHDALAFWVERQPPNVQVVMTSRQDPLLPLPRWRARGLLAEVRLKDLRFSEEEAAAFLNRALGFDLQPADIAALESRTEGWIAGLQLAAISLLQSGPGNSEEGVSVFVQSFAGNDRFVMDYLIDEVLSRQPERVQRFLLHTSVLERFNAGLCEAVTGEEGRVLAQAGSPSPAEILGYLDRANLFLVPLDNRREWYRYHHLFAELLQHRLKSSGKKALVAEFKRRASAWFAENDVPDEAVRYALSAADWELSSRLIHDFAPRLMLQGETVIVMRWLDSLPGAVVFNSAQLSSLYGYILTITGRLDLGRRYLDQAEQLFAGDPAGLGGTLAYTSYNACFQGDFRAEIDLSRRALELLPGDCYWQRGIAWISLGLGLHHTGDPWGSESAMLEALVYGQRSGVTRTCVHALTYLGRISILRLGFQQAESYFLRAMEYKVNGRVFPSCDMGILDLVQLKYEQNLLDEALALVELGLEVNQRSGGIEMRTYAYRQKARLHQLRGEHEPAREYLQKAIQLEQDFNLSPLSLALNAYTQIEMAMADGDWNAAGQAAARMVRASGVYPFVFYPELGRVRYHALLGQRDETRPLLEPVLERVEQKGWEFPRLQVRLLQALAESDPAVAQERLREALALAEPAGAMRSFLDLGAPMRSLLQGLRPRLGTPESGYADRILAAFAGPMDAAGAGFLPAGEATPRPVERPAAAPAHQALRSAQNLVEPLTEREMEVLRLLAEGLTNAEIAHKLYLSPNTLKAHTQNIYSKMDVHSRVQVVNKARELGLIQ